MLRAPPPLGLRGGTRSDTWKTRRLARWCVPCSVGHVLKCTEGSRCGMCHFFRAAKIAKHCAHSAQKLVVVRRVLCVPFCVWWQVSCQLSE